MVRFLRQGFVDQDRLPDADALLRAMMRNPEDYSNPNEFRPERFLHEDGTLNPAVRDPRTIAFGFGRRYVILSCLCGYKASCNVLTLITYRICPGRHFSLNTLSIFIASVLHIFVISPGLDDSGNPVLLDPEPTGHLFGCVTMCRKCASSCSSIFTQDVAPGSARFQVPK